MSRIMEIKITKPKLASKLLVKTAVWVRKPGPMADVAIRKAAAMMGVAENFLRDEKNLFILWVE
jgi:hypothetical protein